MPSLKEEFSGAWDEESIFRVMFGSKDERLDL